MAIDFTSPAWTEVDPGADITVATNKITATNVLSRQDTFHVYRDMGAGYFGGDFTHKFEIEFSNDNTDSLVTFWMLSNDATDLWNIDSFLNSDCVALYYFEQSASFLVVVFESGVGITDAWTSPQANTTYYITVTRDDDGGVNNTGRYTCDIRTGSHAGALQDTLIVDSSIGQQNDFRYITGIASYDNNANANTISCFIQNLEINHVDVNDTSHVHTADSPSIIQILSILAVNDSSHTQTASSPTLQAIYNLLVNDASHAFTADSPLLVVYLAVLDAIHSMSADSPVLSFIPAETLRMIYTGKVPGVNYTAAVPKVQLTGRKPGVEFE